MKKGLNNRNPFSNSSLPVNTGTESRISEYERQLLDQIQILQENLGKVKTETCRDYRLISPLADLVEAVKTANENFTCNMGY